MTTTWVGTNLPVAESYRSGRGVENGLVRMHRRIDKVYWVKEENLLLIHGDGGDGGFHESRIRASDGAWMGGGFHQPARGVEIPPVRSPGDLAAAAKKHPSGCAWWQSYGTFPFAQLIRVKSGRRLYGAMNHDNAVQDARAGQPFAYNAVHRFTADWGGARRGGGAEFDFAGMTVDHTVCPTDPRLNVFMNGHAGRSTFRTVRRGDRLILYAGVAGAVEAYAWDAGRRLFEPVSLLYTRHPSVDRAADGWPAGVPVKPFDNNGFTWNVHAPGKWKVGPETGSYETYSTAGPWGDREFQVLPDGDAWAMPYDRGARGEGAVAYRFPVTWSGADLPRYSGRAREAVRLPKAVREAGYVGMTRLSEDGDGGLVALVADRATGPYRCLYYPGWARAARPEEARPAWTLGKFSPAMRRGVPWSGPFSAAMTGSVVVKGGYLWEAAGQGSAVRVYRLSDGAKVRTLSAPGVSDTTTLDEPTGGFHAELAPDRSEWRVSVMSHVGGISVIHRVPAALLPPKDALSAVIR